MRRSAGVGSVVGGEGGAVRRGCAYADLFVAGFELGYRDGEGVASATVGRFGEDRDGGRTEHRDRRFSGRARGAVDPVDQLPVRLHDGVGFAATADHVEACSTCP